MLFTPNVRERFSKVLDLRRFHKRLRSEAYSAEAVSLLAPLFHPACGHMKAGLSLPGFMLFDKAPWKRDSNPRTPVLSRLLYHLAIHIAVDAFQDTLRIHAGFEPAPPRSETGCSPPELMDSSGLLSVSFAKHIRFARTIRSRMQLHCCLCFSSCKHKIPLQEAFFMEKKLRTLLFQEKVRNFLIYSCVSIVICRSSRSLI